MTIEKIKKLIFENLKFQYSQKGIDYYHDFSKGECHVEGVIDIDMLATHILKNWKDEE
jgi:hypothetical protein